MGKIESSQGVEAWKTVRELTNGDGLCDQIRRAALLTLPVRTGQIISGLIRSLKRTQQPNSELRTPRLPSPLQDRIARHRARCEQLRLRTRDRLARALRETIPGVPVLVFGSLTRPGAFHLRSDVDLALSEPVAGHSTYALAAELEERVGRPVDLVLLSESRLAAKIRSEAEPWTNLP